MDKLPDGIYEIDIRSVHIDGIIQPRGGAVIALPDGRQAIISPNPNTVQIVEGREDH